MFAFSLVDSCWFNINVLDNADPCFGDLDDDGVTDIAVGANLDDDGGINAGAAWILFMAPVKIETDFDTTEINLNRLLGGG